MEQKEEPPGFFQAFATCRTRDLCLRYMNLNPREWIYHTEPPCPCSREFYNKVAAFARVLEEEKIFGSLHGYTHSEQVDMIVGRVTVRRKANKKERVIHENQKTLFPGLVS